MLDMLGLEQLDVVVNKMDSIKFSEERFKSVRKNLVNFLSRTVAPKCVIPISAKKGDNVWNQFEKNMDWYRGGHVSRSSRFIYKPALVRKKSRCDSPFNWFVRWAGRA